MSATELLSELTRRGIELQAHGDKLRYRPRSALTPELTERVRRHKLALLALLRGGRSPQPPQGGQNRPVTDAMSRAGRVAQPNSPDAWDSSAVPHELSLVERVESGYLNPGWTAQAWAERLCQLADRCEALRPELAAQYRRWAANVLKNEKGLA